MVTVRWTLAKLHILVTLRHLEQNTLKGKTARLKPNQVSTARALAVAGLVEIRRVPRSGRDGGGTLGSLTDSGRALVDSIVRMMPQQLGGDC